MIGVLEDDPKEPIEMDSLVNAASSMSCFISGGLKMKEDAWQIGARHQLAAHVSHVCLHWPLWPQLHEASGPVLLT